VLWQQLSGLAASVPGYVNAVEDQLRPHLVGFLKSFGSKDIETAKSALGNLSGTAMVVGGNLAKHVLESGLAVMNLLSLILITPIVIFYLLRDWHKLIARFDALLPLPYADTIREQLAIIDKTMAGFVRGQLTVCMMLGVFYAVCLSVLGLKFAIVIGLLTGLLAIVPYAGIVLGALVGMSVGYFQFEDWSAVAAVGGIFAIGQFIEGNFVTPKLVGDKVGLHPVWIIFGMLAGGTLFGFVGIFLAIPITAIIGVLLRFAVRQYLRSTLYTGAPTSVGRR
jgi:predicted PurR-regulated permease PerM